MTAPPFSASSPQTFADGNFDIVSVSNGDAAIRKFEELRPISSWQTSTCRERTVTKSAPLVKKHPELGDTPVVLLAGAFDAFDEETASQVGAAAHITKPFEPQALVNLVVSLCLKKPAKRGSCPALPQPVDLNHSASCIAMPKESVPRQACRPTPSMPPRPPTPLAKSAGTTRMSRRKQKLVICLVFMICSSLAVAEPLSAASVSDELIERIADRVIQKLSTQVIENVAWDVVPDITAKVLREELKRQS